MASRSGKRPVRRNWPRQWPSALLALMLLLAAVPAAAERFRFDWPVPSAARVTTSLEQDDVRSTARYRIEVRESAPEELSVEFQEFELLTVNGADATAPALARELAPLVALTAALPALRIAGNGAYLGVIKLEEALARSLELLPPDLPEDTRARLQTHLRKPAMRSLMEQRSGEVWNLWVGAWNGVELVPGQSLQGRVPVRVMQRDIQQQVVIEYVGAALEYPGAARLRMTSVLDGARALGLAHDNGNGRGEDDGQGRSALSQTVSEISLRPDDLLPFHVVSTTEVVLRERSGKAHNRRERREYWFEWETAGERR